MLAATVLAILVTMVLLLIRAFQGPTEYDRMLATNMFGTKTVLLIAVGGYALDWESYADVALLYAMVNFVSNVAVMRFFAARKPESEGSGPSPT